MQAITGVLLTFYYVPTPDQAYESVAAITNEVRFGWYIRSLHKWSANLMVVALLLHMMRVFFTGAYRKPREGNWILGCCLLMITLVFGFTGYSLVYEQLSYWGATVAGNILEAVPFVGMQLADFLRGGATVGSNMLTRLFVFHIGALPTLMVVVLMAHLLLMRTHGVSELGSPVGTGCQALPLHPGSPGFGNHSRPGAHVLPELHGDRLPGGAGAEGRSAGYAGAHQAGMVFLLGLPLAEAHVRPRRHRHPRNLHRADLRLAAD